MSESRDVVLFRNGLMVEFSGPSGCGKSLGLKMFVHAMCNQYGLKLAEDEIVEAIVHDATEESPSYKRIKKLVQKGNSR